MHAGSLEGTIEEAQELLKAQPRATLASWVPSKLPKCIHNSIYAQLRAWTNSFITWPQQLGHKNMFYFWLTTISSHDTWQRKTKVSIILIRHNQFSNSWTKMLSLKLSMKNLLRRIKQNYNENAAKQSTNTQWKWRQTKSKYSHWSKHLCQAKVKGSK